MLSDFKHYRCKDLCLGLVLGIMLGFIFCSWSWEWHGLNRVLETKFVQAKLPASTVSPLPRLGASSPEDPVRASIVEPFDNKLVSLGLDRDSLDVALRGGSAMIVSLLPRCPEMKKLPCDFWMNACSQSPLTPAVDCQASGRAATWSREFLRAQLHDFVELYKKRPIQKNLNGMNVNHQFALFFLVKTIQPRAIIELGVYRGQGTWLLREAAGPNTPIFSLDPVIPGSLAYQDTKGMTTYYVGKTNNRSAGLNQFIDFSKLTWDTLIPNASDRRETLVVLDDHNDVIIRVRQAAKFGFRYFFADDNLDHGSGDTYSFHKVCTAPPLHMPQKPSVTYMGGFGSRQKNVDYLRQRLATYFEFPPLLDRCGRWYGNFTVLDGVKEAVKLGLPNLTDDIYYYSSFFPPFVEIE